MIPERRKAWLKDKLHGLFVKKFPNLMRLVDLAKKPFRDQIDHMMDENFHQKVADWKRRAYPFVLAFIAGCLAPDERRRNNQRTAKTT
ncbi:MAG TPA: hypothetical protein PKZ32_11765 [Candidatus Melainabacteria bacterium]|nr:hypothetical protein [Candidatus Melainabacteria bacterium]